MESVRELFVCAALVAGGSFTLLGAFGLVRFPETLLRLHGPGKATTLGLGGLLIASMLYFGGLGHGPSVHELLIAVFVALTAPVSTLCIARVALDRRSPPSGTVASPGSPGERP